MTTQSKPKCKLISHAAFRFSFPIQNGNALRKKEKKIIIKKMKMNEKEQVREGEKLKN